MLKTDGYKNNHNFMFKIIMCIKVKILCFVSHTGDTTFEVFQKPSTPADLFKVKLLIVEATYVDLEFGKDIIKQARDRGHIHLFEIFQNAELFRNVDKILLIHFSDKYSIGYINEQVNANVPESLRDKIIVSQQR